jgi:serine protease inhibitor
MDKFINGIYATAMNDFVYRMYEEIEDDDTAENFCQDWLALGVPDGNQLTDNINDFGDAKDFQELQETFVNLCKSYGLCPNYSEDVKNIYESLGKMLDNPYYNMV